ncbi:phosphonate transport system permease protein [Friedmanniella luteola]|uniref:Phosphonate transport system permease protein n=1 Tax=Friedmanniella luteola TaxID=546871 RepID=A0A1H1MRI2_9ACTN|nr:ABC transporter permease subunit [Friedmanniella luteola]SDR89240.1 phosphonate transport system permease protein [Friedmanniella luteola]
MSGLTGISSLEAAQQPGRSRRTGQAADRGRRRTGRRGWLLVAALALAWSVADLLGSGRPLLNPAGLPLLGAFWSAAARPDLSAAALRATAEAALTTVAFAVLGSALALVLGAAAAVPMSQTWWAPAGGRRPARAAATAGLLATRVAAGLPRGVHEAVWGLLLVSVLGRDPLVGVLAIALPFGAITAKVYSEIIDEADHGPHDAFRAAGAGRLTALCYGIVPSTLSSLTSYAFYRFECSIRAAVILGLIGAGGLGFQLSLSFQGLQYDQMWTSLYALVVLSAAVDGWGAWLRRGSSPVRGRLSAVLAALLAGASVWHLAPEASRWSSARTWRLLVELLDDVTPLRLPREGWPGLLAGAVETLQMSVVAAALATALGVAVAFVAARGATSPWGRGAGWLARSLLLVTRAVPPPVWALLVLFVVLPGPLPGALALGIYTFGILGRLFAEVVENLDGRPRDALVRQGAPPLTSFAYAVVPAAAGQFASLSLYRWEVAVRETVIVGLVGAGGLGRMLEQQRVAFDLPAMATTVLTLVALSLLVDAASIGIRRSLR